MQRDRFEIAAVPPAMLEGELAEESDRDAPQRSDGPDSPAALAATAEPLPAVLGALDGTEGEPLAPSSPGDNQTAPVRQAKGKGTPIPLIATYGEVISACLDGIALAARHRALLPREGRAREEERILSFLDALVVTPRFPALLIAWWEEAVDLPDPWKAWAPTFVLACLDGEDLPEAIATMVRRLPEDDAEAAAIAGEALALGAHPERFDWARHLIDEAHPAVRAAGIEALSLAGALGPDELARVLASDAARTVRWAAVRAAARLPRTALLTDARPTPEERRLDELLLAELNRAPDAELTWQTARALALRGIPAGYYGMVHDASMLHRLGPRALDVLAFFGTGDDAPLARRIVARCGLSSAVLRGLGRYGHPGAAPVLVRALGDEDAADDASAALVAIFGVPFEEQRLTSSEAWRTWLATAAVDEAVRHRFGKPYRPGCMTEAAADGTRSQAELSWLVDEANVRAGLAERPALWRWSPAADASLAPALAAMSRADGGFLGDPWRSVLRSRQRRTPAADAASTWSAGSPPGSASTSIEERPPPRFPWTRDR
ncbi:hypothetical protein [Sorangium sp. So ce1153]|uniref:hypothetical protein n=1 Tax=Sorangium sp. So ce1153 TaxID=3133333 RepID=UPI003F6257F1